MNLRNFVSQALLDIIGAVEDAQKQATSGAIVPGGVKKSFDSIRTGVSELQAVDFEVTVRADERAGSEAKLSVVAAVIGGAVKGDSAKSGGHASTLKFRVPICLPIDKNRPFIPSGESNPRQLAHH
jgi:hypothetical protein